MPIPVCWDTPWCRTPQGSTPSPLRPALTMKANATPQSMRQATSWGSRRRVSGQGGTATYRDTADDVMPSAAVDPTDIDVVRRLVGHRDATGDPLGPGPFEHA